jgi:hypothetical protein
MKKRKITTILFQNRVTGNYVLPTQKIKMTKHTRVHHNELFPYHNELHKAFHADDEVPPAIRIKLLQPAALLWIRLQE